MKTFTKVHICLAIVFGFATVNFTLANSMDSLSFWYNFSFLFGLFSFSLLAGSMIIDLCYILYLLIFNRCKYEEYTGDKLYPEREELIYQKPDHGPDIGLDLEEIDVVKTREELKQLSFVKIVINSLKAA
jgi:hypothetical protein